MTFTGPYKWRVLFGRAGAHQFIVIAKEVEAYTGAEAEEKAFALVPRSPSGWCHVRTEGGPPR